MKIMSSPDAADEPQQQEESEPRSHAGQASKHPVNSQGHDQDPATPPLVSQVPPYVATKHHSYTTGRKDDNKPRLACSSTVPKYSLTEPFV